MSDEKKTPPGGKTDTFSFSKIRGHAEQLLITDEELPLGRHIVLFIIALFFVVFVLWANWATLDEVTRGDGRVIPSSETKTLQSLEGGIVEEFLVAEGQQVETGQVLMRLRDVQASSDLGSNRARYLGLLAIVTRLQAEAEGANAPDFPEAVREGAPDSVREEMNAFRANRNSLDSQLSVLRQQLRQREQEVRELNQRAADLRGVLQIAQDEKDIVEPLVARGSAPEIELLQLERAIRERRSELNGVQSSLPRARAAIKETEAQIEEVQTAARAKAQSELSAQLTELSAIKETLTALEDRKTRTEIKAPVNGIVQDIKINTVTGVVRPGEDIIDIVPVDDQLLVEVKIRPKDIAFVYPGQPAVVKITAYDFSIYGGLPGEVVDISADTFTNEKDETFYRVRVRTEDNSLKRKGEVLPIIPGMVAGVDILTGEKTVMEYLLKPFIKTLDLAMNER